MGRFSGRVSRRCGRGRVPRRAPTQDPTARPPLSRRCLRHGPAGRGHQLPRDIGRVGVVRVREDDDPHLVVELEERLGRVVRISATMPDVGPVLDAADIEPRPVPEDQFSSTERTRCISRSEPVLTICAPPRSAESVDPTSVPSRFSVPAVAIRAELSNLGSREVRHTSIGFTPRDILAPSSDGDRRPAGRP